MKLKWFLTALKVQRDKRKADEFLLSFLNAGSERQLALAAAIGAPLREVLEDGIRRRAVAQIEIAVVDTMRAALEEE